MKSCGNPFIDQCILRIKERESASTCAKFEGTEIRRCGDDGDTRILKVPMSKSEFKRLKIQGVIQ